MTRWQKLALFTLALSTISRPVSSALVSDEYRANVIGHHATWVVVVEKVSATQIDALVPSGNYHVKIFVRGNGVVRKADILSVTGVVVQTSAEGAPIIKVEKLKKLKKLP